MKKNLQLGHYLNGRWWIPSEIWRLPRCLYRETKAFVQRGLFGYAPCDVWSLDSYLCSWMPQALRELKEAPVDHKIDIDKMIEGFELADKGNDEWEAEFFLEGFDEKGYMKAWKAREKRRKECMQEFVNNLHGLWY